MNCFFKFIFYYRWTVVEDVNNILSIFLFFSKDFTIGIILVISPILAPWNQIVLFIFYFLNKHNFSRNLLGSSFPETILIKKKIGEKIIKIKSIDS